MLTDLIASFVSEDTFKEHGLQYVWQYLSFAVLVNKTSHINKCLDLVDENVTHVMDSPDFLTSQGNRQVQTHYQVVYGFLSETGSRSHS